MSILIFCGPIDNDFFNCRTNLLNKLCDIYVTVHSVLSNVDKIHSRLPAGMIFQTPVVSDVNSVFFRFSTYFSSGFLQKRGKSTFTSTTISRKRQNTLPVLFSIFSFDIPILMMSDLSGYFFTVLPFYCNHSHLSIPHFISSFHD